MNLCPIVRWLDSFVSSQIGGKIENPQRNHRLRQQRQNKIKMMMFLLLLLLLLSIQRLEAAGKFEHEIHTVEPISNFAAYSFVLPRIFQPKGFRLFLLI